MADINLVRIDFRLIHGQVVTKWVKQANANRIIIVNDMLAKDEFLASVYKMAAPSNVKVDIFTVDDAMAKWTTDQFGEGKVLLLFKNVSDIRNLQRQGSGRINTSSGISFDAKDVQLLKEMIAEGSDIHIQVVPTQQKYEIEKVIEKLEFNE